MGVVLFMGLLGRKEGRMYVNILHFNPSANITHEVAHFSPVQGEDSLESIL